MKANYVTGDAGDHSVRNRYVIGPFSVDTKP